MKDNITRDQVLTHIKDKNLESKLYQSENLTLSKLLEVVSQYHDKDALIHVQPEEEINRAELTGKQSTSVMKFQGRCWIVTKSGTWPRTVAAVVTMFANLVEDWAILLFVAVTSQNRPATKTTQAVNKEPLCRPKEGGDEKNYMLSPKKRMARNERMMHSTCLLPPLMMPLKH